LRQTRLLRQFPVFIMEDSFERALLPSMLEIGHACRYYNVVIDCSYDRVINSKDQDGRSGLPRCPRAATI
jgi:hypothetical protein